MKKILLLLLFTVPVVAQNGFKMENGKIVWERAFSASDIKAILAANENLKVLKSEDGIFIGQGEAVKNSTNSGSVRMKCDANFDFTIAATSDGYVVRVTDYMFLEKYGPMQIRTVPNSLEKYYMEYGKIRQTPKTQADLAYVNTFLTSVFTNQPVQDPGSLTYN